MNNADITVSMIRKLEAYTLDRNASPNGILQRLSAIVDQSNKASKQITNMEAQLNRVINALDKKGMFNGEIISAFTGLDSTKAKELEKDLEEAKKVIINV